MDKSGDSLRSSTIRKKLTKERYFESLKETNR